LEAESRNSEEVHRYQVLHVILKKVRQVCDGGFR
jgi:hypothetical protein